MVLAPDKMYRPTDIAVDVANSSVYVVEQFNHRISKWDYLPLATPPANFNFTLDDTWGNNMDGTTGQAGPVSSPTDNNLDHPTGIIYNATDNLLYVTDRNHNRVRTIDPTTGAFTTSIGTSGTDTDEFFRPTGIGINNNNTVIVIADEFNHRAIRYAVNAGVLENPLVVPDPSTNPGESMIPFNRPHGLFYDPGTGGKFLVCDSLTGLLSSYFENGDLDDQSGTPGTTGTDLFYPASGNGVLSGTFGNLFADTRNNNIKTFDAESYLAIGTIPGTDDGELYWPESAIGFMDSGNYVLAANTLNNRI